METKPLLYGLGGFMLGGLIVSLAATALRPPADTGDKSDMNMSMNQDIEALKTKKGDAYDKAFIKSMKMHHQDAIDMAELSATNASRAEIKMLSNNIIDAQQKEIDEMTQWEKSW